MKRPQLVNQQPKPHSENADGLFKDVITEHLEFSEAADLVHSLWWCGIDPYVGDDYQVVPRTNQTVRIRYEASPEEMGEIQKLFLRRLGDVRQQRLNNLSYKWEGN